MTVEIRDRVLGDFGIDIPDNELAHYGKKGMKWGVINERGSNGRVKSEDHTTARQLRRKRQSEMSNAELKKVNERLQLERTNKELQSRGAIQKIKLGTTTAAAILAVGTTITTAYNFVNSPAGQALIKSVKKS
jgi:hypothetical protein